MQGGDRFDVTMASSILFLFRGKSTAIIDTEGMVQSSFFFMFGQGHRYR